MGSGHGKNWVLLAAGSKGWQNYRHQADVCHAYQIVHHQGIPDEQIVVMMYDDLAYHPDNPTKGIIINEPLSKNVYTGVPKDYTGSEVTVANFLAALRGDKKAVTGRKVIDSNKNDSIFVYMVNHGGPGLFCFPDSSLHAEDLVDTLTTMSINKKCEKVVIFVESCHSGSMLAKLPTNVTVYGTTACPPNLSSYATYYDHLRHTFLADVYSAIWMHYAERTQLEKTTFEDLFKHLQRELGKSDLPPCQQYGDLSLCKQPLSEFVGRTPSDRVEPPVEQGINLTHLTASHDVPHKIHQTKIEAETDHAKKKALQDAYDEYKKRQDSFAKGVASFKRHCSQYPRCVSREHRALTRHRDFKIVAEHYRLTFYDLHDEQLEVALSAMHAFVDVIDAAVDVDHILKGLALMKTTMEDACK